MDPTNNVIAALKQAKENDAVLQTLHQLWGNSAADRDDFIGNIVSLHNSGEIDIVSEFSRLRNDDKEPDFFLTRRIFEKALPTLHASVAGVARCVVHLVTQAGQDLAAGTTIEPFQLFLQAVTSRPSEALSTIENDPTDLSLALPATIASGFANDREFFTNETVRLTNSLRPELRRAAILSLGSIGLLESEEVPEQVAATLETVVTENEDDGVLSAAFTAAATHYREYRRSASRLEAVMSAALVKGGELTLDAASRALAFRSERFGLAIVELLSGHLKDVPLENSGTIRNIDFGVSSFLESTGRDVVLHLMESVLRRAPSKGQMKSFPHSTSQILAKPALLSKIVTRWLCTGEPALCKAAADLIQDASHGNITLEADPTEIVESDTEGLIFVAHKAIGYLFFWPVATASFVVSLMRIGGRSRSVNFY